MTAHVQPSTYEAQLRAGYSSVTARLSVKQSSRPAPTPIRRPMLVHVRPDADQHVVACRAWEAMHAAGTQPADFIRLACKVLGCAHADIMSHRRGEISTMRHKLIRMTSERYPHLSSTKLGELFGRDHTVALSALRRDGRVNKYTAKLSVDEVREIKRRAASGHERIMDIAASYGIVSSTISNIISGRTWRGVE